MRIVASVAVHIGILVAIIIVVFVAGARNLVGCLLVDAAPEPQAAFVRVQCARSTVVVVDIAITVGEFNDEETG